MADRLNHRRLANHLHSKRVAQGISLGVMSRAVGYRNASKGANRIQSFERTGIAKPKDLVQKLADVLGVSDDEVQKFAWLDYLDWQRHLNEPVPMVLLVRLMPAVYCHECIPPEITAVDAEELAAQVAKDRRQQVCLIVSRRTSVWFDTDGNVIDRTEQQTDRANAPSMEIGGKRFLFHAEPKGEGG